MKDKVTICADVRLRVARRPWVPAIEVFHLVAPPDVKPAAELSEFHTRVLDVGVVSPRDDVCEKA